MTSSDAPTATSSPSSGPTAPAAAARTAKGAFAVVAAGLVVVAATPWRSSPWWGGWALAAVAVVVMAMASRRRSATFTGDDAKRQRGNALVAGLARGVFCVCLAVLALLLSRWARDYSLTVSAQTGSCQTVTDVGSTTCTYHYTVNGRTYDVPGPGHGSDGPTTVRVDPAHPDDLYRAQKHLWVMWLMMIPPALLGALTLRGWRRTERQIAVG